jgi:hypothetical protein
MILNKRQFTNNLRIKKRLSIKKQYDSLNLKFGKFF